MYDDDAIPEHLKPYLHLSRGLVWVQGDEAGHCPQEALEWARSFAATRKKRAEDSKDTVFSDKLDSGLKPELA